MTPATRLRARATTAAALVAATALLLAGCGAAGHDGATTTVAAGPSLAELATSDDLLADPRAWTGEVVVEAAQQPVEPVVADARPQLPVTVTDTQGTEVTVTDTSRILALDLYGTLSRTVFELGLGENVVGRDASSTFPEILDLPVVTSNGHELTAEAILEMAPTVILTDTTLGPWDVVLQMRDAGIPVVVVDPHRSTDDADDLTRAVADALGMSEAGEQLAERTQSQIDATVAEVAALAPADDAKKLRVVFLYVRGQSGVYYMFGEGSGADSLIESVGAVDVAGEIGWKGMRPVNDEGMVSAQPDVILMMSEGLESVGGVDGLLERLPAIAQTPAGQNRRIVAMPDSQILAFGPSTTGVLDSLARGLYAPGSLG